MDQYLIFIPDRRFECERRTTALELSPISPLDAVQKPPSIGDPTVDQQLLQDLVLPEPVRAFAAALDVPAQESTESESTESPQPSESPSLESEPAPATPTQPDSPTTARTSSTQLVRSSLSVWPRDVPVFRVRDTLPEELLVNLANEGFQWIVYEHDETWGLSTIVGFRCNGRCHTGLWAIQLTQGKRTPPSGWPQRTNLIHLRDSLVLPYYWQQKAYRISVEDFESAYRQESLRHDLNMAAIPLPKSPITVPAKVIKLLTTFTLSPDLTEKVAAALSNVEVLTN